MTDLDYSARAAVRAPSLVGRDAGYAAARTCLQLQTEAEWAGAILRTSRGVALADNAEPSFVDALGEIEVGRHLARLGDEWLVLHSVPVGEHKTEVDHLLIGPGGVFAITTKHHPGASVWIGDGVTLIGTVKDFYQRASLVEATRVGDRLSAQSGTRVAVTPVVAILGADTITDARSAHSRVRMLPADELVEWLAKQPHRVSDHQLAHLRAAAEDPDTWHRTASAADAMRVMPRFLRLVADVQGLPARQSPSVRRALTEHPARAIKAMATPRPAAGFRRTNGLRRLTFAAHVCVGVAAILAATLAGMSAVGGFVGHIAAVADPSVRVLLLAGAVTLSVALAAQRPRRRR